LIGRARAYLALQEPENAARDFTRALELRPNDPSVRIARAAHCERLIQRASAASRQNDHAGALRFPRQAARIDPAFAKAHNNLAWLLLTGPADLRNPAEALRHAYRAVELVPAQSTYHNTLGVALYRNGQLALAVPVLRKSLAGGKGQSDAFDLFFLAMCHARLGDRTKAKDCFDRAVTWSQKQKNLPREHQEELKAFRAEAEEVLRNVQPAK
jgi:tetratricopeptide (TPR) repeat protein